MHLNNINLTNFRNYENLKLTFNSGTNVFIGKNAQGKTNLLESIYVLAMVRSHRTSNNTEMIKWGESFSKLDAEVTTNHGRMSLELILSKLGKKAILNHLEQKKLSQYIGKLNVILFTPNDLNLIKGSPSVRRRFVDMEIGQIDKTYLENSSRYNKVLKQRNLYLKKLQKRQTKDLIYLDVLSDQLAGYAAEIIKSRNYFLGNINKYAQNIHKNISNSQESLKIVYRTLVDDPGKSVEEIYNDLLTLFSDNRDKDIRFGSTTIGPHHDDIVFMINDINVQKFGSQGQQRSAVLSLKLSEIEVFNSVVGDYPILLLDDVLSELDQVRQTNLLKSIEDKIQTFITTTSLDNVDLKNIQNPKIFRIDSGGII